MNWSDLPAKVFVSHSFQDEEQISLLKSLLQPSTTAVIWPFQEMDPAVAVSNGIVDRINSCDGLIYLSGGHSKQSLWVEFEKDFGRRSELEVFSFDAETRQLIRDSGRPIPLNATLVVSPGQEQRIEEMIHWMKTERHFNLEFNLFRARMKAIPELIANILYDEKTVIWCMDKKLGAVAHLAFEFEPEQLLDHLNWRASRDHKGMYHYSEHDLRYYGSWLSDHSMFATIDPAFELTASEDPDIQHFILSNYPIEASFRAGWAVHLYPESNNGQFDWNKADDLIVRLTLKLLRARPFKEEEEEF